MTDILTGLRTYLLAQSGVSSLVGTTGVYQDILPQSIAMSDLPKVVLNLITTEHHRHLTGTAKLAQARIQVDSYSKIRSGATALAEAIRAVMDHYTGTMGSENVRNVTLLNDTDGVDYPVDGSESFRCVRSSDYLVTYVES